MKYFFHCSPQSGSAMVFVDRRGFSSLGNREDRLSIYAVIRSFCFFTVRLQGR